MELDDEMIQLIGQRRTVVMEIGRVKQELDLPVLDPAREAQVVRTWAERARDRAWIPSSLATSSDGLSQLPEARKACLMIHGKSSSTD